ncbi:MAG: Fe-S cluster assembly protein SufD [Planctomycetes bacterium]|nr:Fe-S cluster assembly protein SufD [Planctomycetota bacterium]
MADTETLAGAAQAEDTGRQDFSAFLAARRGQEPEWLEQARADAFARFSERGYPTRRDEDWKYTSVEPLCATRFAAAPRPNPAALVPWLDLRGAAAPLRVVLVNGRFERGLSSLEALPAGLVVSGLKEALAAGEEDARALLLSSRPVEDAFTVLNTALFEDAVLIRVAAGAAISPPLEVLSLATTARAPFASRPRVALALAEGARLTLLDCHAGCRDDDVYFSNALLDADLGQGAFLEHVRVEDEARSAFHVSACRVAVAGSATYNSTFVTFGGRLARNRLHVVLAREEARADLRGLYRIDSDQHADHHTTIDHAAPKTTSRELYKGVIDGKAQGVFCGRILVRPGAQKTSAEQSNANLLLAREAAAHSTPQLEIYADDVQCRHGSTIGQLDEEMLFYIRSRGIDRAAACGLLTYAFGNEVIERIGFEPLRDRLSRRLLAKTGASRGQEE